MRCIYEYKEEDEHIEIEHWIRSLRRWIVRAGIEQPKAHSQKEEIDQLYKIIRNENLGCKFHLFSIYYSLLIFYQHEVEGIELVKIVRSIYTECITLLEKKCDIDKTEGSAIWEVLNQDYDIVLEEILED